MELLTLVLFCAVLFICVIFGFSILYALGFGFIVFSACSILKGHTLKQTMTYALSGIKTVKNILITFMLIGILTALWRSAGTIPTVVCYASRLVTPTIMLPMTFLLNCLISTLTGTAFGTAATMGVICAAMSASVGIPSVLTGGAVLAGAYFGDRCSPVSTSALLVSELTGSDIFTNIKNMLRSAAVPFVLSCAVYFAIGFAVSKGGTIPDLKAVFGAEFSLSAITVLPAAVLLVLSALKVKVKAAMAVSILCALPICIFVQQVPIADIPRLLVMGYTAKSAETAVMLNGGGILSMVRVASIVCISSAYSGIFRSTGLLDNIKGAVNTVSNRTTPYIAALLTSIITGMIACNQTLTIMLTNQLTSDTEPDRSRFALTLEDTAVTVAPLVPWSIAGGVPLASAGAPTASILFACFLYILPLWRAVVSAVNKNKK